MAVTCDNNDDNQNRDKMIVDEEEEDYIDMEVSSLTHFFSNNKTFPSPQHAQEFAFHLLSSNVDKDSTPSPADELFYKGKLLPLHLPPRLQMVEKLLLDSPSSSHFNMFREVYGTPLGTTTTPTPTTSTPFESCNISPVDSCQVSRELRPEEYLREYPYEGERKGFVFLSNHQRSSSWTKKIKSKIKSLFGKSGYPEVWATNISGVKELPLIRKRDHIDKEVKVDKKTSKENEAKEEIVRHRRSFSGAFKRRSSTTKLTSSSSSGSSSSSSSSSTSSSISSNNSNSLSELLLKRSSSANSEIETSLIQGAIAHCKQSQQTVQSRKTLSEVGCHSFPSKFVAFDDEDSTTGHCRG